MLRGWSLDSSWRKADGSFQPVGEDGDQRFQILRLHHTQPAVHIVAQQVGKAANRRQRVLQFVHVGYLLAGHLMHRHSRVQRLVDRLRAAPGAAADLRLGVAARKKCADLHSLFGCEPRAFAAILPELIH